MRTIFLAFGIVALAGCAHGPTPAPPQVVVTVGNGICLPASSSAVLISLRNASGTNVAFATYGSSGPPYKLYAGANELLNAATGNVWAPVLDEFVPPSHEVSLGPGDEATFQIAPSAWPAADDPGAFMVEVRDTRWRSYRSAEQAVCPPGSSPNNSSKPTPLRGAA